ncbi:MAG TPA: hypothetical protein VFQ53_25495 [Kofleriaceae bacterium]|nr:hypothetical protein [Kofleriaceae bacterium]
MKALAGAAIVALHAVGFALIVPDCKRPDLVLEVPPRLVGSAAGTLPDGIAATREVAGTHGLAHARYSVAYRGGYTRSVGVTALVGPFQDRAKPACTGRVVVGQRLLDDGKASPGTVAGTMTKSLDAELRGMTVFGIGDFQRATATTMRWAQLVNHPDDRAMVGAAPHGYVRVTTTLVFDRVGIPLVVALVPEPTAKQLGFRIASRAELDFDNGALQWISDKLGGDRLASRLARREIEGALVTALAPPPPFELPGGQQLVFAYCDGPPEIVEGVAGALPFAVVFGEVPRDRELAPPRHGPAPRAPLADTGMLAIELDLDAANALLFELWRTGYLDRELARAGLDRRFNTDPIVTELLTLRISPPVLALPPVLGAAHDRLQLYADARVAIADGAATTIGRVWGGLDFRFADQQRPDLEPVTVDLGALELSCERRPTTLVPCYADLVAALRDRGADFHGALTRTFSDLLDDIFVDRRVSASGLPAELVIRAARPSVRIAGDNASVHLELDAALVDPPH